MINSNFKKILKNYIKNNYKEYILVSLLFIIGIFLGVMVINNCKDEQLYEISTYINEFITKFKETQTINRSELIVISIKNNLLFAIILWVAGTTILGMPVVFIIILFRGLILGYTISAITFTLGIFKGLIFSIISLLLQNILFIPALLTLGVSSIKFYKSIIKDRNKDIIKTEIFRHTAILFFVIIVLIISSLIENSVIISILKNSIKYF